MAGTGIPLGEWSGSNATRELHESIREFNSRASAQTNQMVSLTRVLTWLTGVMLLAVVVQVALAVAQLLTWHRCPWAS